MKKSITLALILLLALPLASCSGDKVEYTEEERKNYDVDKIWVVDGNWNLQMNYVKTTDERTEGIKEEFPQVIIIDFTYENTGYKNINGDEYGLLLIPAYVKYYVDGVEYEASQYPLTDINMPQELKVGEKSEHAQQAFSVPADCTEVVLEFSNIDSTYETQRTTFKMPIK